MIDLILQGYSVVNDIRGDNERDAGEQVVEHGGTGGDGHVALGREVGYMDDQQLQEWCDECGEELEQPKVKQKSRIPFGEDFSPINVGKGNIKAFRMPYRQTAGGVGGAAAYQNLGSLSLGGVVQAIRLFLLPLQSAQLAENTDHQAVIVSGRNLGAPVRPIGAVVVFKENVGIEIQLVAEGVGGGQQAADFQPGDIVDVVFNMGADIPYTV